MLISSLYVRINAHIQYNILRTQRIEKLRILCRYDYIFYHFHKFDCYFLEHPGI